jgi:hypothetical protein
MAFSTPQCLADLTGLLGSDVEPGFLDISGSPLTADGGGLSASGAWNDTSTTLSWVITNETTYWHYEYTFTAEEKALSHFILQVSDTFTDTDIWNVDPGALVIELDDFSSDGQGSSNLGMPGPLYALKFEDFDDEATSWTWSFDTLRDPVWSHFYAVDGLKNSTDPPYVYNSAFDNIDDTLEYYVAAPDTTVIPVPPAILLGMIGLSFVGVTLRKLA